MQLFIACLILLLIPSTSHAGAWTKPAGQGEIIVNSSHFASDGFYDRDGNHFSQPEFSKAELNPYLEYGLSNEWTIGANLFLHYVQQDRQRFFSSPAGGAITIDDKVENWGLGDPEFFARYQLYKNDTSVISLQPLIKLPSLYDKSGVPRSGSDSLDSELSAMAGHSFQWRGLSHYIEGRIGYRHRFDDELDGQIRADAKLGLRLHHEWELIPAIYTIWATGDHNPVFTEDGQNDFDLIRLEAMLRYNLSERLYVQGGPFGHVYGRNVGDGYGLLVSTGIHF